ncbi:anti-sigma factor C-terminal domain-containing protein [Aquibacillus koreensis]|uniref:Anti-sigma factor C-terminal domain-containing protein n=1 Tax=Aquibacillus koreensis TaxID=279446 RepID=A0A9X3WJ93_9BACI|nr:anti-sigma factor C-terminal domain-containing protein [Aquibacillus koreensis]MCT2537079.1 anti-sigma factor C-terminal domain-containing protein [Aquibacillus koreensis]MDC3419938.1 anti-sigma factor C-terminal domain-containing protein [Aquibacillus koreensis]
MSDKKKQNNDIDFISNSSFQKHIKKTKWKQIGLYILISTVTLTVAIFIIHNGSQYLIHKKIEEDRPTIPILTDGPTKGAGVNYGNTRFHYNLFSVDAKTTYFKRIGNRKIVWDTETKNYPAIGRVEVTDRGSGFIEDNPWDPDLGRSVVYNHFNDERVIEFYFPGVDYDFLPQELDIATGLDENKLIEIALSFQEPMVQKDLGEVLGKENVDWLWVPSRTKEEVESNEMNKIINGNAAYGIPVNSEFPYWENAEGEDRSISGAIVSGTPQELERFLNMDFVRASTIGVTIDKY